MEAAGSYKYFLPIVAQKEGRQMKDMRYINYGLMSRYDARRKYEQSREQSLIADLKGFLYIIRRLHALFTKKFNKTLRSDEYLQLKLVTKPG